MLNVLEGTDVDLLQPFPVSEIHRAVGWMHCYRTLVMTDDSPPTPADVEDELRRQFLSPGVISFGIIDKLQKLNIRHEAPLIGFISVESRPPREVYIHCATTRKAWGSGMIDEAMQIVFAAMFTHVPELLRLSALVLDNNYPAKALARRIGMRRDGFFRDMFMQNGNPVSGVHFGLTRQEWNESCQVSSEVAKLQPEALPV